MKIYVDKLPKNCKECEYFSDWLDDGGCYQCIMPDNERALMYPKEVLERSKTCPLQSIADHDAELLQNAIVPKFKVGQTVYGIRFTLAYEDVVEFDIDEVVIGNDTITYKGYYDESFAQRWLFATREEAEQKLKEIE